jgi:hypothetical protein
MGRPLSWRCGGPCRWLGPCLGDVHGPLLIDGPLSWRWSECVNSLEEEVRSWVHETNAIWPGIRHNCLAKKGGEGVGGGS